MHTLHSRDTWLKQARVVRLGEVPYKVTARCYGEREILLAARAERRGSEKALLVHAQIEEIACSLPQAWFEEINI